MFVYPSVVKEGRHVVSALTKFSVCHEKSKKKMNCDVGVEGQEEKYQTREYFRLVLKVIWWKRLKIIKTDFIKRRDKVDLLRTSRKSGVDPIAVEVIQKPLWILQVFFLFRWSFFVFPLRILKQMKLPIINDTRHFYNYYNCLQLDFSNLVVIVTQNTWSITSFMKYL